MFKLKSNILAQGESLSGCLSYHADEGASTLADAAALLRSGRKVVITGMGASLFASIPLQYFLCSQGIDVVLIEAAELLHYLSNVWTNAVVLMVSRSGESVEIARLLERMKVSATVIGVTNEPDSRLAKSADMRILTSSLHDEIVAIQTYTGTILTLYLLGAAVTNSLESAIVQVRQLLPAFVSLAETSMENLTEWERFLIADAPVYLLARGPSIASAHEGALLFHEVAKSPAVAMPIASFRHGPVEVVDRKFRAFVFMPEDATRDLNLALVRDVIAFGGQVRPVGPVDAAEKSLPWLELPRGVPATLAPMFEIVPLQAAAYQMAVMRGVEPGSFRFAPQVAVDEASFRQGSA